MLVKLLLQSHFRWQLISVDSGPSQKCSSSLFRNCCTVLAW